MKKIFFKSGCMILLALGFYPGCSTLPVNNQPDTIYYIVTFDAQGGNGIFSQLVPADGKVTEPTPPVKEHFLFSGWYKEAIYSNTWEFASDTVISNIMLYARWIENSSECIVTFDSCGGSPVSAQVLYLGEKVTEPAQPDRWGYIFGGWFEEPECTNEWIFTNNTLTSKIILYAKWIVNHFTVNFETQGGTWIASQDVLPGEKALKTIIPTKSGVLFCDWYKESTCLNRWDFLTETVNMNITLYAKWANLSMFSFTTNNGVVIITGCFDFHIQSVLIPDRILYLPVTEIKENAFLGFIFLSSVTLPDSLLTIGSNAFSGCILLPNLSIPYSVTSIDSCAFQNCMGLKSLFMHPLIAPLLGTTPFSMVSGCVLYIPVGATGYNVNPWTNKSIFSSIVTY